MLAEIPDSHLNGHPEQRLPNNAHFRFHGVEGEAMVLSLRDAGIAASTGSACSSKTLEPSHTLISCGLLHEEAHGSLEFTFGRWSTMEDVDRIMAVAPRRDRPPPRALAPVQDARSRDAVTAATP